MEVMIESERPRDIHLIDYNLATAVRKTPILVIVLRKDIPWLSDVFFRQEINLCDSPFEEFLAKQFCSLSLATCAQECKYLIDYVIGR